MIHRVWSLPIGWTNMAGGGQVDMRDEALKVIGASPWLSNLRVLSPGTLKFRTLADFPNLPNLVRLVPGANVPPAEMEAIVCTANLPNLADLNLCEQVGTRWRPN